MKNEKQILEEMFPNANRIIFSLYPPNETIRFSHIGGVIAVLRGAVSISNIDTNEEIIISETEKRFIEPGKYQMTVDRYIFTIIAQIYELE